MLSRRITCDGLIHGITLSSVFFFFFPFFFHLSHITSKERALPSPFQPDFYDFSFVLAIVCNTSVMSPTGVESVVRCCLMCYAPLFEMYCIVSRCGSGFTRPNGYLRGGVTEFSSLYFHFLF